jgi:hypothetical protein
MPYTSILLGIYPDFDKRKVLFENNIVNKDDYYISSNISLSLKNNFFLNKEVKENENCIIESIKSISSLSDNWNNFGTPKINSEIISNSLKITQALPPSILNYLKPENVYPTKMGTIIMDWEIDENNILSLEIAKKSVGYFVEMNGNDYKEIEKIDIEDSGHSLLKICMFNNKTIYLQGKW